MMDLAELASLLLRAFVYGATLWSLALTAWPVVRRRLPHAPGSLRLASLILTLFALNAVVVKALGLVGLLRTPYYLVVCALLILGLSYFSDWREVVSSLLRLLRQQMRLWSRPRSVALATCLLLFLLLYNSLLVDGVDSLSMHGPWIVDMVQSGRLLLETNRNFPLLWEIQHVPAFMILRSDVFAIVPKALLSIAVLLSLQAAARRLRVPGRTAQNLAWLCVLCPLLWRNDTLKNDTALAVGMIFALMALERIWKRRQGGIFLTLLGGFFLVGSKATGIVYAGLLIGLALALEVMKTPGGWSARRRRLALLGTLTLVVLAISDTMQIANYLRTGSPFHPVAVSIGPVEVFSGPRSIEGTSILEHAGSRETWTRLVDGATHIAGPEFPILMLIFVVAWFSTGVSLLRARLSGKRMEGQVALNFVGGSLLSVLWFLYLQTPWSRGQSAETFEYLVNGGSLRFATGQLFATYVLVAAFLEQWLGWRICRVIGFALPVLIFYKWYERRAILRVLDPELLAGLAALVGLGVMAHQLRRAGIMGVLFRRRAMAPLRAVLLLGTVGTLLTVFGRQVEAQRQRLWMPSCRPIWQHVHTRIPPASKIALNNHKANYRYLLYGADLGNVLIAPPPRPWMHPPLPPRIEMSWLEETDARYLYYKITGRARERDEQQLAELHARGWITVAKCDPGRGGELLEQRRAGLGRIR